MEIIYLVCANEEEADKIADVLLEKRMIACAKKLPVQSRFRWEGKIDSAKEILLLLETKEGKFEEIEPEVRKIHSHDTFVMTSIKTDKVSDGVEKWLESELGG